MKRQFIEMYQEYSIVCDNKQCDYKVKSPTGDPNEDIHGYLNVPCPKCGENLLTVEDYLTSLRVLKVINWLNKYLSWTMYLFPKSVNKGTIKVKCHNGIKIEQ